RRAVEETAVRKRSADQGFATCELAGTERSPLHDPQPDGLREARTDRMKTRIWTGRSLSGRHGTSAHIAAEPLLDQRQVVRIATRRHPGQGRQSRDKTIGKGHVFCARWPLRRGLE